MNKEGLCFSLHMCSLKERIRLVFLEAPGTFFRRLPMFGFQTGAEERWSPDSAASLWNRLVQVEGVAGLFSRTQPPGCHSAVSPCLCTHMKGAPHWKKKKSVPSSSNSPNLHLLPLFLAWENRFLCYGCEQLRLESSTTSFLGSRTGRVNYTQCQELKSPHGDGCRVAITQERRH